MLPMAEHLPDMILGLRRQHHVFPWYFLYAFATNLVHFATPPSGKQSVGQGPTVIPLAGFA